MEQTYSTPKKRTWKQINENIRYKIEGMLEMGHTKRQIAKALGYSVRTIQREINQGSVVQRRVNPTDSKYGDLYIDSMKYCADYAQRMHVINGSAKGPALKIGKDYALSQHIERCILEEKQSPEVICGRLRNEGQHFKTTICAKTIYNYLDKEIFLNITNKDLLRRGKHKRKHHQIRKRSLNNKTGTSIEERPLEIAERKEKGHWEIDLVIGKSKPAILTLVERKSRKAIFVRIKDKTQKEVLLALRRIKRKYGGDFQDVFKTITTDNGSEFLDHNGIKKAIGCSEVYYAHSYSSWEKGSIENLNGMLRRFFPKGTDFRDVTDEQLKQAENWINHYPRKILGFKTADEVYEAA